MPVTTSIPFRDFRQYHFGKLASAVMGLTFTIHETDPSVASDSALATDVLQLLEQLAELTLARYCTHREVAEMKAGAEGCCPADLVHGRDIKCAASRSLCLVPRVKSKLHRAVEILVGDKAYSTQVAVCWQQSRVAAACR